MSFNENNFIGKFFLILFSYKLIYDFVRIVKVVGIIRVI